MGSHYFWSFVYRYWQLYAFLVLRRKGLMCEIITTFTSSLPCLVSCIPPGKSYTVSYPSHLWCDLRTWSHRTSNADQSKEPEWEKHKYNAINLFNISDGSLEKFKVFSCSYSSHFSHLMVRLNCPVCGALDFQAKEHFLFQFSDD